MSDSTEQDDEEFGPLLQGKDAWWDFLDAKTQGRSIGGVDVSSNELELEDVGRASEQARAQRRPDFTPHMTQSVRCAECTAQIPVDLPVCVWCGQSPEFRRILREQTLRIEHIDNADVFSEVVDLLIASNDLLKAREVWSALAQPPAVFFFQGSPEQALGLSTRLGELGVRSTISPGEMNQADLAREVFESVMRDTKSWLSAVVALVLMVGLVWLTSWSLMFTVPLFLGIVVLAGTLHTRRFVKRYELNVHVILDRLTGFTPEVQDKTQRALALVRKEEIGDKLTICLMSYYAMWRQMASAPPQVRILLIGLRTHLEELIDHVLNTCLEYGELEALRLQDHLPETMRERLDHVLPLCVERLDKMCHSMEDMRARLVLVTSPSVLALQDGTTMDGMLDALLHEIDEEVVVFEQTLDELAQVQAL